MILVFHSLFPFTLSPLNTTCYGYVSFYMSLNIMEFTHSLPVQWLTLPCCKLYLEFKSTVWGLSPGSNLQYKDQVLLSTYYGLVEWIRWDIHQAPCKDLTLKHTKCYRNSQLGEICERSRDKTTKNYAGVGPKQWMKETTKLYSACGSTFVFILPEVGTCTLGSRFLYSGKYKLALGNTAITFERHTEIG